jgi:hypothetical protein
MTRTLYFKNKQFIQKNPNNDIRDVETLKQKYLRYKDKEEYPNEIAGINTHGIVRSSFFRLDIHPTTSVDPCYLYDLPSICHLEPNLKYKHYLV